MSTRLKIPLLVVLAVLLLYMVPLPFLNGDVYENWWRYPESAEGALRFNTIGRLRHMNIMQFGIAYYVGVLTLAWGLAMFIPPLRRSMLAPGKWNRCITVGVSLVQVAVGGAIMVSVSDIHSNDLFWESTFSSSPYTIWGVTAALVAGSVAALCASSCITRKGLGYGVLWVIFALKLPPWVEELWSYIPRLADMGAVGILPLACCAGMVYAAYRLFTATSGIPLVKDGEPGGTLTLRYVPAGFWCFLMSVGVVQAVSHISSVLMNLSLSPEELAINGKWIRLGLYVPVFVAVQYRMARIMFPMERLQAQLAERGLALQGGSEGDTATALKPRLHLMAWHGALCLMGLSVLPLLVEYACTLTTSPLYRPDTCVAFSGFESLGTSIFELGAWISGLILLHRMDKARTTADASPTPSYFIG